MNFQELMTRIAALDTPVAESEKTADKDYDGDGKIESGKDEYMGSRMKAAEEEDDVDEGLDQLANEVQQEMDECGLPGMDNMPSGMMGTPKQSDNVSMNLSMNGSGSGGIRDLMDILRNLEDAGSDDDMGSDGSDMPVLITKKDPIIDDNYENSPAPVIDMNAEFPSDHGDDLHKEKASFSDKPYRGDNPMAAESLKVSLGKLYQDIISESNK